MAIRRWLRALRDRLRDEGPVILLWHLLAKSVSLVGQLSIVVLLEKDLRQPLPDVMAAIDVAIDEADEAEIEGLIKDVAAVLGLAVPADGGALEWIEEIHGPLRNLYLRRLQRGEKCFVARIHGIVTHISWMCFAWAESLPGHPIVLGPGEVCAVDGHTPRPWRGKGIDVAVANAMLRVAQRDGYHRAFATTKLEDRQLRRRLRRAGWRGYGTALYFKPRGVRRAVLLRLGGRLDPLRRPLPMDLAPV